MWKKKILAIYHVVGKVYAILCGKCRKKFVLNNNVFFQNRLRLSIQIFLQQLIAGAQRLLNIIFRIFSLV